MNVFQQLSEALRPHRESLEQTIAYRLHCIEQLLEHGNRLSDLGKPDTDDQFLRLIRKGKFPKETLLGRPRLGEYWLIQAVTNNGVAIKSPAATIRTNVGAVVAVLTKEAVVNLLLNGTVVALPGEELILEPEAEGEYDLTVHIVRRKIPQHVPDATAGQAQGDELDPRSPSSRYEPERYLPDILPGWQGVEVPAEVMAGVQEGYGGLTPEISEPPGNQE